MVILIGGESHAGKTLFSQRLMQRTGIPYTSLDHIKMGLVRAGRVSFSPNDGDELISRELWGVVKGMIDTCLENKQNIILEGCYLPPERVAGLVGEEVLARYLIFSPDYVERCFAKILSFESTIERRKTPMEQGPQELGHKNMALKAHCASAGLPVVEIKWCYEQEIAAALDALCEEIARLGMR